MTAADAVASEMELKSKNILQMVDQVQQGGIGGGCGNKAAAHHPWVLFGMLFARLYSMRSQPKRSPVTGEAGEAR